MYRTGEMLSGTQILLLSLCCVSTQGQLTIVSNINPTYNWVCQTPAAGQSNKDMAILGGCMPDALCVDGKSPWTNVFG